MSKQAALKYHRTQIAGAIEDASGNLVHIEADDTSKSLRVNLWVWDTGTMAWVKMVQPASDVSTIEDLLAGVYWKDERYDYTSGNLDYKGLNTVHDAATSATTWNIYKYTWSGTNLDRIEGPLIGSWDGRAALSWG